MDINKNAIFIIKSTVLMVTQGKLKRNLKMKILFFHQSSSEGYALHDNLNPSRIIMGEKSERAKEFADLLIEGAAKDNITPFIWIQ